MEIELITTKKKITKSIINQMRVAGRAELEHGVVLGYFINVRKHDYKTILIKICDEYFIVSAGYEHEEGELFVYRQAGRVTRSIRFDSVDKCNSWWKIYQGAVARATNQIYI